MGWESVWNRLLKMYFKFLLLFCFVLFSLVHGSQLKKQYPIRRNSGALRPPMNFRKSDFVETKYFNQYLDHFTPTDTTKWKQARYFSFSPIWFQFIFSFYGSMMTIGILIIWSYASIWFSVYLSFYNTTIYHPM